MLGDWRVTSALAAQRWILVLTIAWNNLRTPCEDLQTEEMALDRVAKAVQGHKLTFGRSAGKIVSPLGRYTYA